MMKNAREKRDVGIYGIAAKWYDKNSRKSRMKELCGYADIISRHAGAGASILEVAPGPGYLSIELAKRGYQVISVEISPDFVAIAKRNAAGAGVRVDFRQGNASELPCADGVFDFIICTAAFKNFKEPEMAIREMYRVLKPGGAALIADMNRESTAAELDSEAKKTAAAGFDRWFVKLAFKSFLKQSAYSERDFDMFIANSPFGKGEITKDGVCLYVWLRKNV